MKRDREREREREREENIYTYRSSLKVGTFFSRLPIITAQRTIAYFVFHCKGKVLHTGFQSLPNTKKEPTGRRPGHMAPTNCQIDLHRTMRTAWQQYATTPTNHHAT